MKSNRSQVNCLYTLCIENVCSIDQLEKNSKCNCTKYFIVHLTLDYTFRHNYHTC